jgi:hypothetical protein
VFVIYLVTFHDASFDNKISKRIIRYLFSTMVRLTRPQPRRGRQALVLGAGLITIVALLLFKNGSSLKETYDLLNVMSTDVVPSSRIYTSSFVGLAADPNIEPTNTTTTNVESPIVKIAHTTTTNESHIVKIAHAVSFVHCARADRVQAYMDALVILRHSIHQNSIHNNKGQYSYQMYAFIHDEGCPNPDLPLLLKQLGYIAIRKPTPVNISEIPNEYYKRHVEQENCCGSREFIKLYAYTLTHHPIVVHWDIDVAVLQPMDDLYDSILFPKTSVRGAAARARLAVQRPETQLLPDVIDAFVTRDVTSAQPWEKVQAVQGGFLVARPSMQTFEAYLDFIRKGHYEPGRGERSGWGVSLKSVCSVPFYLCIAFVAWLD